jgi:hypothetical protein
MPVIKSFRTDGDNFLRKTLTTGDNNHQGAVQYYEKMAGSDGTTNTVFTLAIPYAQSTNSLMVFVNGQKVEKVTTATDTTEYQETSSTSVTFGSALLDSDVVEFYIVSGIITNDFPDQLYDGTTVKLNTEPNGATLQGELGKSGTDVCAFFAYLDGTQANVAVAEAVVVNMDAIVYDYGSDFNTTTHVFTAPYAGRYHFDFRVSINSVDSAATSLFAYLVFSTETDILHKTEPDTHLAADGIMAFMVSCDMELAQAETVTPTIWVTGGAVQMDVQPDASGYYTYISGHFIG